MTNKEKYQAIQAQISSVSNLLSDETKANFQKKMDEFYANLNQSQYIKVPIVGIFNAGKSSLLNVFSQKPGMLPVDTTPETAVAYELYYDISECVELYRNGEKIDQKNLEDIKSLQTKPGDIAKVYCNSQSIKALQERGIILVDMPGIGSGIERHDAAIFNYIKNGTAFLLAVDAEQGSLRGSTQVFIDEICRYGLYPSIIVTKIDKKSKSDVKEIVEYIQYQMSRMNIPQPLVGTISAVNNDFSGFQKFLDSLNYDELVGARFNDALKNIIKGLIEQLQLRVKLRTNDIADVDKNIAQIEEEIANVKAELPGGADADTPEKSTRDVIDAVNTALNEKVYDIASMLVDKTDKDTIQSLIMSTIRTALYTSLKEESEQYTTALGQKVSERIPDIAAIEVSGEFMENYGELYNSLRVLIEGMPMHPILKTILIILPEILDWLLGKSREDKIEEVADKIRVKMTEITANIEPTVYKITVENQKRVKAKIQEELISKMECIKDGLREKKEDANKSKETISNEIATINDAIKTMVTLSDSI